MTTRSPALIAALVSALAVVGGCGLSGDEPSGLPTVRITPDGGRLSTDGSVVLDVPFGALSSAVDVSIRRLRDDERSAPRDGLDPFDGWEIGPGPVAFDRPVRVSLSLGVLPGYAETGAVHPISAWVTSRDGKSSLLDEIELEIDRSTGNATLEGSLDHFSTLEVFYPQRNAQNRHVSVKTTIDPTGVVGNDLTHEVEIRKPNALIAVSSIDLGAAIVAGNVLGNPRPQNARMPAIELNQPYNQPPKKFLVRCNQAGRGTTTVWVRLGPGKVETPTGQTNTIRRFLVRHTGESVCHAQPPGAGVQPPVTGELGFHVLDHLIYQPVGPDWFGVRFLVQSPGNPRVDLYSFSLNPNIVTGPRTGLAESPDGNVVDRTVDRPLRQMRARLGRPGEGGHVGVVNNGAEGHYAIHYRCIDNGLALLRHTALTVVNDPNGPRTMRADARSQVCCHERGRVFTGGSEDDPCKLRYAGLPDDEENDDHGEDEEPPEEDGPGSDDDD